MEFEILTGEVGFSPRPTPTHRAAKREGIVPVLKVEGILGPSLNYIFYTHI